MEKQIRENKGKPRFSLVPMWLLDGAANVFEYGATKYETWNWTKGDNILKLLDSAYRHIIAFQSGDDNDEETGESHIDHAIANLLFIKHTMSKHPSYDDRIGKNIKPPIELPAVATNNIVEEIPEELRDFLLKEGVLVMYKNNCKNHSFDGGFEQYIGDIDTAFKWSATPEGNAFWSDLNEKWENI
jgi:hypothetical protein